MVNKKRLIALTQQLIRINSENPGGNERAIAEFVKKFLEGLGIKARIYEFAKKRSNVVATVPGLFKNHSLLITPHLDTVPAGTSWKLPPFSGVIRKGRLYGLGATDCKGNVACALEVLRSLVEDKCILRYNLVFAATAEEESGSSLGLIPLLDKGILACDAAVVLDSDDFDIVITQKGLMHLKVKLRGKKAHGAYPWLGINAIDAAVALLHELKQYHFKSEKNKYLLGPTVNIGTIHGGDKVNVVADWCEVELDFRFLPGMSEKKFLENLKKIIRRHAHKFTIEIEGVQQPYCIEERHLLVRSLKAAMKKLNAESRVCGSEGATTVTFFQDKKIPAIATGFGSHECAHIADEYVLVDNLYKGARVLEEFLKNYIKLT